MSAGIIAGSASSAVPATGPNQFAQLKSEDFIRIMVEELSNQDPFEPNDSQAILEQISSLQNIESQSALQEQLGSLVSQNALASAGGFIGQFVKGINASNQSVEGLVTSLRVENGQGILRLADGTELAANRLTEVQDLGDLDTQLVQELLRNLLVLNSAQLTGMTVSGTTSGGRPFTGVVEAVRFEEGDLKLELQGGDVVSAGEVEKFGGQQGG